MKVKTVFFLSILILVISCKGKNDSSTELDKLFIKIDSIFESYKKENYINDSVLDYYKHKEIDCSNLDEILEKVYFDDQDVRHVGNRDMYVVDSINQVIVTSILKNCQNELQKTKLSRNAYSGLFLVIQHSNDVDLMVYFYDDLKNLVNSNKLDKGSYALFIDRLLVKIGKKQIFATQLNINAELYDVENIDEVNKRRKYMDLRPIIIN